MNALETGLYGELSGTSAITTALGGAYIYNQVAPQGQDRPYIIFAFSGGGEENINPSDLINSSYLVKAVADSPSQAGTIDALIKTALHNQTLTVGGYTNIQTQRENHFQLMEVLDNGKTIHHRGAYYRIRLDD